MPAQIYLRNAGTAGITSTNSHGYHLQVLNIPVAKAVYGTGIGAFYYKPTDSLYSV